MFSGFSTGPGTQEDSTSPDDMLRQYAARRATGTAGPMSPPPGSPSSSSKRLTLGVASPGAYSPSMGAYGVQSRWE
jgi:hypothetical protein